MSDILVDLGNLSPRLATGNFSLSAQDTFSTLDES